MRPVVSFVHSPMYNLSKHLYHLLSSLVGNCSCSEQFAILSSLLSQHIQDKVFFCAFVWMPHFYVFMASIISSRLARQWALLFLSLSANMVMEEIEERAPTTFSLPPRFWKHYVDNNCTVLPRSLVTEFHDHLNAINSSIQFTFEEEEDLSLPFLDVLVQRHTDGTILTSVFRKATHTNNYLKCFVTSPSTT